MNKHKHFRIGILGGMGPEAGVLLQRLIIEATPAETDQDHIEVVTYTNPHVPDRTRSLREDGGESYLAAVIESLQLLEKTGVDILVMACNTAHARMAEIQKSVLAPMFNIVEPARREIQAANGRVGILATDGTLNSGLFSIPGHPEKCLAPPKEIQAEVMAAIHSIKKGVRDGSAAARLEKVVLAMRQLGCEKFVLGCTEISIYYEYLRERQGDVFIDPLRLAAAALVQMAKKAGC